MHTTRAPSPHYLPSLSLACLAAMVSLPMMLAYHEPPIANFYAEWLAAWLGLLACGWLLWPARRTSPLAQAPSPSPLVTPIPLSRSALLFIGLCGLNVLPTLFSPTQPAPQLPLIQGYLLWAAALATLGLRLRLHIGLPRLSLVLAWALLLAGAVNACFVLLQWAMAAGVALPMPRWGSLGLLAQNNHLADLTALALWSLCVLFANQRLGQRVLWLGMGLGLVVLSLSGARTGLLYVLLIAALCWMLTAKAAEASPIRQLRRLTLLSLPAYVLMQGLIVLVTPEGWIHAPWQRAWQAMQPGSPSLRWQFWQTSWQLWREHPWLGIGSGQLRWTTFWLADDPSHNLAGMLFEHAHNLWLHVLAEQGLLGLTWVLVIGGLWLRQCRAQALFRWETAWILGVLAILLLHSQLEYPLWYSYFLGLFAVCLGAAEAQGWQGPAISVSMQRLCRLGLGLAWAGALWQGLTMLEANRRLEHQVTQLQRRTLSAADTQQLVTDMLWVKQHSLLSPYADVVLASSIQPSADNTEQLLPIVQSAMHFMPLSRACAHWIILLSMHTPQSPAQHALAVQATRAWLRLPHPELTATLASLPPAQAQLLAQWIAEARQPAAQQ